tara:strand:- start:472 stop:585 length:114 start_codon:yes stop_codon:yes gene_type:complete
MEVLNKILRILGFFKYEELEYRVRRLERAKYWREKYK